MFVPSKFDLLNSLPNSTSQTWQTLASLAIQECTESSEVSDQAEASTVAEPITALKQPMSTPDSQSLSFSSPPFLNQDQRDKVGQDRGSVINQIARSLINNSFPGKESGLVQVSTLR